MIRQKVKAEADVQMYIKDQKKGEEKKIENKEIRSMFDHSARVEKEYQEKEATKKAQLRKIQQDNLQTALAKKNMKMQEKVCDTLKEKALVDSNAFSSKNTEVR